MKVQAPVLLDFSRVNTLLAHFLLPAAFAASSGLASADSSVYQDQGKLIRAPRAVAHLGENLFGDTVNLYTGSLEFTQSDVSLPGNHGLPVSIGRRLIVGQESQRGALFGGWDLEIPHLHGIFAATGGPGWKAGLGSNINARCSAFGPPPGLGAAAPAAGSASWNAREFWHGSMLYVPGMGDQEMLRRSSEYNQAPAGNVAAYPIVTRNNWAIRCLPSSAPGNGTTGEAFIAVSPDGVEYRFDWFAERPMTYLTKGSPNSVSDSPPNNNLARAGGAEAAMATVSASGDGGAATAASIGADIHIDPENVSQGYMLKRVEVWVLPTSVTDRFGNTVNYTYDQTNKWQLTSIVANDASGSSRAISLNYLSPGSTDSNLVSSVSDGTHTWYYSYDTNSLTGKLTTVTLPDGSSWKNLDAILPLKTDIAYVEGSSCDVTGQISAITATGYMIHPSGARGDFTLSNTMHGRSGVTRICNEDYDNHNFTPWHAKDFATMALTSKTISGPGLPTMSWATSYAPEASSWAPCNGCNASTWTDVVDPANNRTRYTYGTLFRETEGQLQRTDAMDSSGNVLRSSYQQYIDPITPLGVSDQPRGDGDMAARVTEVNRRQTSQQGVDFVWQASAFDLFAKPTQVAKSSVLGSRNETTLYEHNVNKWILGQVKTVTDNATGKVLVTNTYNGNTAALESVSRFGLLQQSMTYNADGTVLTKSDALGHTTTFYNYMRGLPRNVSYPDGSTEAAEINNDGTIAAVIDPLNLRTEYGYDAGGRLSQITYPAAQGDPAWNATTLSFAQVPVDEFDLPAGHWRQDVVTGAGVSRTYFDAFWRPAYVWTYHTADVGNSQTMIKTAFDHAGRATFSSYPQRGYVSALTQGVSTSYDALGRAVEVRADSELGALSTHSYYNAGFTKTVVDPRGYSSTTSFQAFDTPSEEAIATIAAPEGLNVAINRDAFGKPLSITRSGTNPAGVYATATRSYVYDGYERLCKTIEPETGATVQQLDAANNVSWRAPGSNLTGAACDQTSVPAAGKIVFGYDTMNRLTSTSYGDGSAAIGRDYWADGQPKTVSSSGAVWTMNYNSRRLPTTQSLAFEGQTYTFRTDYNANGHPVQLTYPAATNSIGNQSVAFDPDALGRPSHVGSYASAIGYHPSGAIAGFTYGNGKVRSMQQNTRGLPRIAQDGGVLQDVYDYDQNGNVTLIIDQINAGPGGVNTSRAMTYDGLDRLRVANAPGIWGNASYDYDVLDNIRTSTVGTRASTYLYGARNLLDNLQSTASGFNYAYGYDNRGNVTSRGGQGFGFDLGNRLTTAANLDTYIYDGFGRRIKTTAIDGTVTVSVYSPAGQLLYTRRTGGPNPAQSTQYIYLHSHQIAEVKK